MNDEVMHQEHGQFKEKLEELDDLKYKFQEYEQTQDQRILPAIQKLEQWGFGNGGRGAEQRLQKLEDKFPEIEATLEAVKMVADSKIESSIEGVLNRRERTVLAYIKAFGPLVSGLAAIALALLAVAGVKL